MRKIKKLLSTFVVATTLTAVFVSEDTDIEYQALVDLFDNVVSGILGLKDEESEGGKAAKTIDGLVNMVLEQRKAAKAAKDWATSDRIRDDLKALGIQIKDGKDGTEWTLE